jgi:hypothetical protein
MSQIADSCGGGDAGRALVPGSLRGYRSWRVLGRRRYLPAGTLPLTSVTRRRVVWPAALSACCKPDGAGTAGNSFSASAGDHRSPQPGCACGIYGWYAPTDTGIVRARVFGAIEASGLVFLGERGFRAEKARITAVVTRNRRVAAACERAGIAVYRRRRDLVRDHPPEDMSALVGPTPRPEPHATDPQVHQLSGFDGLVFAAMWGRVALIACALIALPTAPMLVTALVAQMAVISLIAARFPH